MRRQLKRFNRSTWKDDVIEDTQPCRLHEVQGEEEIQAVSDVTFYLVPGFHKPFPDWRTIGLAQTVDARALWRLTAGSLNIYPFARITSSGLLVDFPEALIRKMLQVVRQQTSGRIFRVFPNLKADNASGDFWAPGYLVDTQDREFTTQALMIHLAANRLTNNSHSLTWKINKNVIIHYLSFGW